jgi:hypothetical protein
MRHYAVAGTAVAPFLAALLLVGSCSSPRGGQPIEQDLTTPVHTGITATVFWVGEAATAENAYIPNNASAWDSQWQSHFGGVDTPENRQKDGKWPAGFTPKENPFYAALPYKEFDENGTVRPDAARIPWYSATEPPHKGHSILKNHWVKVAYGGRVAYTQWEDVGPMNIDDSSYVFGTSPPKFALSGIDLSPATAHYLGIDGKAVVSWQFADETAIPDGPWKEIVTTRQVSP